MTEEDILALLQADIRKVYLDGGLINMNSIGVFRSPYGKWVRLDPQCGVCAIGAHLLGQPVISTHSVYDFANSVGRTRAWGLGFLEGSTSRPKSFETVTLYWPNHDDEPIELFTSDLQAGYDLGLQMYQWVQYHRFDMTDSNKRSD